MSRYAEFDFTDIKRRSIENRESKVNVDMFPRVDTPGWIRPHLRSFPNILKAQEIVEFAKAMKDNRSNQGNCLVMIGGHVIKCGLAPILADLSKREYITTISGNGSVAVHDVEIALFGHTSETVENVIDDGLFGMTKETADFINEAQVRAMKEEKGLGEMLGELLSYAPYRDYSLLWNMFNFGLPMTIHPMLGAEVIHPHPTFSGIALGDVAHRDFRIFTKLVSNLKSGVVINIGSAVIMPELFIKALSAARNMGNNVTGITAANFDMTQHYRPSENVLKRPTQLGGKSYSFTGHHEIMIPLLAGLL